MNLLDSINQFLRLFVDTFRQVPRWRIWLPLVGYFLLQWLVLYAHYDFLAPPFYGLVSSWASLFGSDQATAFSHYPQHFLLLGKFSGWARLGIGLVLEGLVLGMIARLFHSCFTSQEHPGRRQSWLVRWLNLVVVWAVINALMVAAGALLPGWLAPLLDGPRRMLAFNFVLMPFIYTMVFSVFFLAIPAVSIRGENALVSLAKSLGFFFRRPFTVFSLAFFILAVPILLGALAGRPAGIIESFNPELIYWLLVTSLISEMVAYFFWMGTAVRLLSEPKTWPPV